MLYILYDMQVSSDSQNYYKRIGGEEGLHRLVHRFYEIMDTLPEAKNIRALHEDMERAEKKLFMFLSGWMGGPPLYTEQFGHPRLRMRHMPFPIAEFERDQWMACMIMALDDEVDDVELREALKTDFYRIADFMRNKA